MLAINIVLLLQLAARVSGGDGCHVVSILELTCILSLRHGDTRTRHVGPVRPILPELMQLFRNSIVIISWNCFIENVDNTGSVVRLPPALSCTDGD